MSAIVASPRPTGTQQTRVTFATSSGPKDAPRGAKPTFDRDDDARAARLAEARSSRPPSGGGRFAEPQARGSDRGARVRNPGSPAASQNAGGSNGEKVDHPILFQQFFKSVGPRTYAAQVKQATNGNHYIVFTEGRRDDKTGEVRKTRINIFSEDFDAFFELLREAEEYVKAHPLPPEFVAKRKKMWASIAKKKARSGGSSPLDPAAGPSRTTASASSRLDRPERARDNSPGGGFARDPSVPARARPITNGPRASGEPVRQAPPAKATPGRAGRPLPTARAAAGG